jgi:uncharacterized membrane protein YcaP (DUF421 family)
MDFIWESIVLVLAGTVLLRIAGRKAISQMTIAQTVIMISIGSLIIQPIVEQSIWKTIAAAGIFIGSLVILEYLQLKFDVIETLISGKALPVIINGQIVVPNLAKLRFTVDKLEMRLRQQGIANIADVKTATLEANGQLGYELMRHAKPVTYGDLEKMLAPLTGGATFPGSEVPANIFDETVTRGARRAPDASLR